jgi:Spy/CpxP family protein refolding chaperone
MGGISFGADDNEPLEEEVAILGMTSDTSAQDQGAQDQGAQYQSAQDQNAQDPSTQDPSTQYQSTQDNMALESRVGDTGAKKPHAMKLPAAVPPSGAGKRGAGGLMSYLNLTSDQVTKLKDLKSKYYMETRDLRYELAIKRLEMMKIFSDPNAKEDALSAKQKELSALRQKKWDKAAQMMIQARSILTPEQISKLDTLHGMMGGGMIGRAMMRHGMMGQTGGGCGCVCHDMMGSGMGGAIMSHDTMGSGMCGATMNHGMMESDMGNQMMDTQAADTADKK